MSATEIMREIERLPPYEKAAVADALWRQLDEQWQPADLQIAELRRREELAEKNPGATLPIGEEIRRLRR